MIQWGAVANVESLRFVLSQWIQIYFGSTTETAVLHLFQNDITPGINTVIGDLVEADFTGYAPVEILLADMAIIRSDVMGNAYDICLANALFHQGNTTINNIVYGWYLEHATPGALLFMAKRFENPIVFDHLNKDILMEIAFRVPVGGLTGGDDTTESA